MTQPDLINYDQEPVERDGFTITDDDSAAWAVRKLRAARIELRRINRAAEEERARLAHWEASASRPHEDSITYFESMLHQYQEQQAAEGRKTIKLPHGTLSARKRPPAYEFDAETYIAWAVDNAPDTLREPTIDRAAVKQLVKETGEIPPGVVVDPEPGYGFTITTE